MATCTECPETGQMSFSNEVKAEQGSVENGDQPRKAKSILLVEDEALVREGAAEVLAARGYVVLTATNAAEAEILHRAHRGNIDLLLTDIVLPGEPGPELARRLCDESSHLRVLYISGHGEQMGAAVGSGNSYLPKPFCADTLLEAVWQTLSGAEFILAQQRGMPTVEPV
jgi:two-component system, cell cycle sensor histidine kinase and response regulator CckA